MSGCYLRVISGGTRQTQCDLSGCHVRLHSLRAGFLFVVPPSYYQVQINFGERCNCQRLLKVGSQVVPSLLRVVCVVVCVVYVPVFALVHCS